MKLTILALMRGGNAPLDHGSWGYLALGSMHSSPLLLIRSSPKKKQHGDQQRGNDPMKDHGDGIVGSVGLGGHGREIPQLVLQTHPAVRRTAPQFDPSQP
jgi:hypothetical protein